MRKFTHNYDNIISIENLLVSWQEFLKGKRKKKDVAEFSLNLMDNIFELHMDLKNKTYSHGGYQAFKINDPKPRDIHKAIVKDRVLHRAIYRILYSYVDSKFIYDSYSCRLNKGTHKAVERFRYFTRRVSKNNTKQCWILKCDIKKFFVSIDHKILKEILARYIDNKDVLWLLGQVIDSFPKGLPLGNLTSQLLVNIYMNEFDQHIKRNLKVKYYVRYADDFVIFSRSKTNLQVLLGNIEVFLRENLKLEVHPNKVFIKTLSSGGDFLGWVNFPYHRVLRTSTKRRMLKNFKKENKQSYLGLISHGNTYKIRNKIEMIFV